MVILLINIFCNELLRLDESIEHIITISIASKAQYHFNIFYIINNSNY